MRLPTRLPLLTYLLRYPEAFGTFDGMTPEGKVLHFSSWQQALKLVQVSCKASKGLKQMCAAPEDFNFEEYGDFDTYLLNVLAAPVTRASFEQEGSLNAVQK